MGRATVQDIADRLGVSKMTVSRALRGVGRVSEGTRERVRLTAREMGYLVNSDCVLGPPVHRGTSDHCLRLLMPALAETSVDAMHQGVSGEISRGIADRLKLNDGELSFPVCNSLEELQDAWRESRASGVVIRRQIPLHWATALREMGPVIYALATDVYPDVDAVYTNEFRSAAAVQRYLSARGHQDVIWFGIQDHHSDMGLSPALFREMSEGDRARYSVHGQRYASWHYVASSNDRRQTVELEVRDWDVDALEAAVRRGLRRILDAEHRPTAIVLPNAVMADHVEQLAREWGLSVPRDLSLVCYEVSPHRLPSGLTCATVELPMYDVGRAIPDLVERRLADPRMISMTLMLEAAFEPGKSISDITQT